MELWDLYDERRALLNIRHERGIPLPAKTYHIVVGIWIMNSDGQILVTRRDFEKQPYPGQWEITGGAVVSGETSICGAMRELFEETGIAATEKELLFVGTERGERAFYDTYLLRRDVEMTNIVLQPGETVDAKWVSEKQLEQMIEEKIFVESLGKRWFKYKEALKSVDAA